MDTLVGHRALVFEGRLWGGLDFEDNRMFWHEATILEVDRDGFGELIATVRFHYHGKVSHGHFVSGFYLIDPIDDLSWLRYEHPHTHYNRSGQQ